MGANPPGDNLYITGLPPDIDDARLKAIFGAYAEVTSCKVLSSATPGQGTCAALCRFTSVESATWIVQALNGNIPEGLMTPIGVQYSSPPKWQQDGGKGMGMTGMSMGKDGWASGWGNTDSGWGKAPSFGKGQSTGPYDGGKGGPQTPSDNLYVTGLPGQMTPDQLQQIFSGYGTVVQSKILGSRDGSAAALVRYSSVEEATMIKDMLNGNIPEGLEGAIAIRFNAQKAPAWGKGGMDTGMGMGMGMGMGKGPGPAAPPSDNLYITGLPEECDIANMFSGYGMVVSSRVLGVKFGKAAALVRFASVEEASQVKNQLDGQMPPGCQEPIKVTFADTPETKAMKMGKDGGMGKGGGKDAWGNGDMTGMAMYSGGMKGGGQDAWGNGGGWDDWGMGKGCFGDKGKGKGKGKGGDCDMNTVLKAFESSGGLPGGTGYGKGNQTALYISGLPPDCEDLHLYRLFSPFGAIAPQGVRAMMWPDGSCKGFGFVNYLDIAAASAAIESVNGAVLPNGTVMKVDIKSEKGQAWQAPQAAPAAAGQMDSWASQKAPPGAAAAGQVDSWASQADPAQGAAAAGQGDSW